MSETCRILSGHVSMKSVIQWFNYFHDVMTTYLAQNNVTFSNNCTIHVDETAVGGKRKYQRGRIPNTEVKWLFGLVCPTHHKIYAEFIPNKSHESIIPIITTLVQHRARIHSDGANVYKCLNQMNYRHYFVVHERHYVDPVSGIHTNSIENVWSNLKMHLKSICGSQTEMLHGHVDEYIYRYNRKSEGNMFNLMIDDIANQFPV